MTPPETIVAVSSATGRSARGIVRLSGPGALQAVQARFEPDRSADGQWRTTYRATPGSFRLASPPVQVPLLLYVMRAPHSYTREDVVEMHLPGSPAVLDMVLDELLGPDEPVLRPAEPGEFTRRAFTNGRIDLSQAEAVMEVIRARGESQLLAAAARLAGGAGRACTELLEQVTELRAQVEAALDFAPHGIELLGDSELLSRCRDARRRAEGYGTQASEAAASGGCVEVALCGPPNAGKSSLLNRLVGRDRALVHERPGTTRDVVSAETTIAGVCFRLTDTAGLLAHADGADADAVHLARRRARGCHLVVLVLDGSKPLPGDLPDLLPEAAPGRVVCALNKCDLHPFLEAEAVAGMEVAREVVRTSALTGQGVGELREALRRAVDQVDVSAAGRLFNARQRRALRRAAEEIRNAERAVESEMGREFAAFNLREAADALRAASGESPSADVLDRIFRQFCIGK